MPRPHFASVADYLSSLPAERRAGLEELRATIAAALPGAIETISYQIPAFILNGKRVIWIAAFSDHYSIYPMTDGLRRALGAEIEPHVAGKGTLRFDADKPRPLALIRRIALIRRDEVLVKPA